MDRIQVMRTQLKTYVQSTHFGHNVMDAMQSQETCLVWNTRSWSATSSQKCMEAHKKATGIEAIGIERISEEGYKRLLSEDEGTFKKAWQGSDEQRFSANSALSIFEGHVTHARQMEEWRARDILVCIEWKSDPAEASSFIYYHGECYLKSPVEWPNGQKTEIEKEHVCSLGTCDICQEPLKWPYEEI